MGGHFPSDAERPPGSECVGVPLLGAGRPGGRKSRSPPPPGWGRGLDRAAASHPTSGRRAEGGGRGEPDDRASSVVIRARRGHRTGLAVISQQFVLLSLHVVHFTKNENDTKKRSMHNLKKWRKGSLNQSSQTATWGNLNFKHFT